MRKDLEAAFSHSSDSNLRGMGWCIVLQEQNSESTFLFFSSQSSGAAALVLLHNMHHLSCDLPQDNPP